MDTDLYHFEQSFTSLLGACIQCKLRDLKLSIAELLELEIQKEGCIRDNEFKTKVAYVINSWFCWKYCAASLWSSNLVFVEKDLEEGKTYKTCTFLLL